MMECLETKWAKKAEDLHQGSLQAYPARNTETQTSWCDRVINGIENESCSNSLTEFLLHWLIYA